MAGDAANDNEGPFDGLEPIAYETPSGQDHNLNPDAVISYLARPEEELTPRERATRDAYVREYDRLLAEESVETSAERRLKAIAAVTPFFPDVPTG